MLLVPGVPRDSSSELIVGPSQHLPWPIDWIARRAWDEAAVWSCRWQHVLPAPLARTLAGSVELLQRPEVTLFKSGGSRLMVASNDPLLRACLFRTLGGGAAERVCTLDRAALRPGSRFDADLVALEIASADARDFARQGWLVLPRWVAMEIDLLERDAWDVRKRETVRCVERSALELEVARDKDSAREFHERMYEPTVRARHGKDAIVVRQAYVDAAVRTGWLLFVRERGERRAGLLVVPRPGPARALDALKFGVRNGDYAASVLAREAAYLFAIRWAREAGAKRFGLTRAAPFVRDGVLRYKKRWGARAGVDPRQATSVALRLQVGSPDVCRAIVGQPPIVLRFGSGNTSLVALRVRGPGLPAAEVPSTPGVELVELEVESPQAVPRVLDRWARHAIDAWSPCAW